jgi:hypothetical protein
MASNQAATSMNPWSFEGVARTLSERGFLGTFAPKHKSLIINKRNNVSAAWRGAGASDGPLSRKSTCNMNIPMSYDGVSRAGFTARAWIETPLRIAFDDAGSRAGFTARAWIETAHPQQIRIDRHGRAGFTARAWIETSATTGSTSHTRRAGFTARAWIETGSSSGSHWSTWVARASPPARGLKPCWSRRGPRPPPVARASPPARGLKHLRRPGHARALRRAGFTARAWIETAISRM